MPERALWHVAMLCAAALTESLTLPRFVYRAIRVGSAEHQRVLRGESLVAKTSVARVSVRDHVLRGSGSTWAGSQYVSTTSDLSIAVRFGAPCNPIVRIDLDRFDGDAVDLSSDDAFADLVPPGEADCGDVERADMRREADAIFQQSSEDWVQDLSGAPMLWDSAAATPWECARMFATRSKEILLCGEIPSDCYEVVDYEVKTTRTEYLCGHSLPKLPRLEQIREWSRCDSPYDGLLSFQVPGQATSLHLKRASANVRPDLLGAKMMCDSIDHEFAAFSFYRLVETRVPSMEVHVRDCAKVSFDVVAEGTTTSLKCTVFEKIDSLEPARVAWRIRPEEEAIREADKLAKAFEVSSRLFENPALSSSSRRFVVTTEELVARWREKQQFSAEVVAQLIDQLGPGKRHDIDRIPATEFALVALKAVAVDVLLANRFGWGVFDKAQLYRCNVSGKLYRMSADTALGASGYRTEPLNADRREERANLAATTFLAAAANEKYFKTPTSVQTTYVELTGKPLPVAIHEQFEALSEFAQEHREEILEIFEALPVPGGLLTLYQISQQYAKQEAWLWRTMTLSRDGTVAGTPGLREFWHTFVYGRLMHARQLAYQDTRQLAYACSQLVELKRERGTELSWDDVQALEAGVSATYTQLMSDWWAHAASTHRVRIENEEGDDLGKAMRIAMGQEWRDGYSTPRGPDSASMARVGQSGRSSRGSRDRRGRVKGR